MNKEIALEVALQRLQAREKEVVEAYTLYNEALLKIKELEEELNKLNEALLKEKELEEELNRLEENN